MAGQTEFSFARLYLFDNLLDDFELHARTDGFAVAEEGKCVIFAVGDCLLFRDVDGVARFASAVVDGHAEFIQRVVGVRMEYDAYVGAVVNSPV